MSKIDVGSDVEAYCTKCKLILNHSVVAMQGQKPRRVRCLTCDGEHIYRPEKPASKAASKKAGKTTTKRTRQSWEEVMREAESKPHKVYTMSGSFGRVTGLSTRILGLDVSSHSCLPTRLPCVLPTQRVCWFAIKAR